MLYKFKTEMEPVFGAEQFFFLFLFQVIISLHPSFARFVFEKKKDELVPIFYHSVNEWQ